MGLEHQSRVPLASMASSMASSMERGQGWGDDEEPASKPLRVAQLRTSILVGTLCYPRGSPRVICLCLIRKVYD